MTGGSYTISTGTTLDEKTLKKAIKNMPTTAIRQETLYKQSEVNIMVAQAVQEALAKQKEELGAGIDMLFSVVNEDCSYFVDGENADKFQELLKLLIKGKMWKVCEDDNTLNEFTSEVIDLINDSREEK